MTELLVCSHRGPVTYERVDGRLVTRQAPPGGLVPIMTPVLRHPGRKWIYAASSQEDREVSRRYPVGHEEGGLALQIVDLPPRMHREHYHVVSVDYLCRLFHYLFDISQDPTFDPRFAQAWQSYRDVNTIYAETVLRNSRSEIVLIEDHHLMLVAAEIRRLRPSFEVPLLYFHHVPWCEPDFFAVLPESVRTDILCGVLAHDGIAFHCRRWARAFLDCCRRFLTGVECADDRIEWRGRTVRLSDAPAPLDVGRVQEVARSAAAEEWVEKFRAQAAGRWTLVRVDRADLWKNALRGFLAFEALLNGRPALAESIWFLALLTPTRTWIPEYRRYLRLCRAAAARINKRFGKEGSFDNGPVTLLVADDPQQFDYPRALAGMRVADSLMVNPIFDGLNLVAKEGMVVGDKDPVLILSQNAGAYEELGEAAIGINPFDAVETAGAILRAVEMSPEERATRAGSLRRLVTARTPEDWVRERMRAVRPRPPAQESHRVAG